MPRKLVCHLAELLSDEVAAVLAATAHDLHEALQRVVAQGWSHVIVDGKLFDSATWATQTTSVKGEVIDAWYSGKQSETLSPPNSPSPMSNTATYRIPTKIISSRISLQNETGKLMINEVGEITPEISGTQGMYFLYGLFAPSRT